MKWEPLSRKVQHLATRNVHQSSAVESMDVLSAVDPDSLTWFSFTYPRSHLFFCSYSATFNRTSLKVLKPQQSFLCCLLTTRLVEQPSSAPLNILLFSNAVGQFLSSHRSCTQLRPSHQVLCVQPAPLQLAIPAALTAFPHSDRFTK